MSESETPGDTSVDDWSERFPYDTPYDAQQDSVDKIIENAKDGGFTVMEAACGSGKTLSTYMAGLQLVRDPDTKFERMLVLTDVKQQLRAFEDDGRLINENLPDDEENVTALTLVGKADVCSYVESGTLHSDNIYSRCDDLRETVRNAISGSSDEEKERELEAIVEQSRVDATDPSDNAEQTNEWMSPYSSDTPQDEACPFYAKARLKRLKNEDPVDITGVMTPEDLTREASSEGVCPHSAMGDMLDSVEVVIGNYQHIFDPITVEAFTGDLISEETLVVGDEAHNIVQRVREQLGEDFEFRTIKNAIRELDMHVMNQNNANVREYVEEELVKNGFKGDMTDVREMKRFFEDVRDRIQEIAVDRLDRENQNWHRHPNDIEDELLETFRNPKKVEQDEFTDWLEENNYIELASNAESFGDAINEALTSASQDLSGYQREDTYTDSIGRVLTRWIENDHEQYFRQLEITPRDTAVTTYDEDFHKHFSVELQLKNCIPSDKIADRLDKFGAGILMSATLAPLDMYQEVVGISQLSDDRPVQELVYGIGFPEENRASYAVKATAFTNSNRGTRYAQYRDDPQQDAVRRQYKNIIQTVVDETDGNVMIAMPNYDEAQWVDYFLDTDKEVITHESGTGLNDTEVLKERFFSGGPKVLVTSAQGTLTEGVDYDGDKLKACVVCGIPIEHTYSPYKTAIQTAYDRRFGNGYEKAFTVPAVRKARQAIGRVIRSNDDTGVRVLADERYAKDDYLGVREYMPQYEREDFAVIQPNFIDHAMKRYNESVEN